MNRHLFAATLALAACSFAHADEAANVAALKTECAAKYDSAKDIKTSAAGDSEYHFVYAKGEYKGEAQAGKVLPCTEKQYVAYLETADPMKVMAAYPTAAGKPGAKDAKKSK